MIGWGVCRKLGSKSMRREHDDIGASLGHDRCLPAYAPMTRSLRAMDPITRTVRGSTTCGICRCSKANEGHWDGNCRLVCWWYLALHMCNCSVTLWGCSHRSHHVTVMATISSIDAMNGMVPAMHDGFNHGRF